MKKNETYNTPKTDTKALSAGFGLIFITGKKGWLIRDEEGKVRGVECFRGKRAADYIDPSTSIDSVNVKTWEEKYEFWAMMISAIGLMIIAIEKILSFLNSLR